MAEVIYDQFVKFWSENDRQHLTKVPLGGDNIVRRSGENPPDTMVRLQVDANYAHADDAYRYGALTEMAARLAEAGQSVIVRGFITEREGGKPVQKLEIASHTYNFESGTVNTNIIKRRKETGEENQTIISKNLHRANNKGTLLNTEEKSTAGYAQSQTSRHDNISIIYIGNLYEKKIAHEILGHMYLAAMGLPHGHRADLTGRIKNELGEWHKGNALKWIDLMAKKTDIRYMVK